MASLYRETGQSTTEKYWKKRKIFPKILERKAGFGRLKVEGKKRTLGQMQKRQKFLFPFQDFCR